VGTLTKKSFVAVAALASLWSGLMWHLAARSQLEAIAIPAPDTAHAMQRLLDASAHFNLWAAWGAVAAGVALFAILFSER